VASTIGTTRTEHRDTNSTGTSDSLGAMRRGPEHGLGRRWTLAPGRTVVFFILFIWRRRAQPHSKRAGFRSDRVLSGSFIYWAYFSPIYVSTMYSAVSSALSPFQISRFIESFPCNRRSMPLEELPCHGKKWQRKSTLDETTSWPTRRRTSPCKAAFFSAGCTRASQDS
jgi:hypothetical protein